MSSNNNEATKDVTKLETTTADHENVTKIDEANKQTPAPPAKKTIPVADPVKVPIPDPKPIDPDVFPGPKDSDAVLAGPAISTLNTILDKCAKDAAAKGGTVTQLFPARW